MASLSIRKLDKTVYDQLQLRAAEHGLSMEEEARRIIAQAVAAPERITQVFRHYFGPINGIDLEELNPRKPHEPLDF